MVRTIGFTPTGHTYREMHIERGIYIDVYIYRSIYLREVKDHLSALLPGTLLPRALIMNCSSVHLTIAFEPALMGACQSAIQLLFINAVTGNCIHALMFYSVLVRALEEKKGLFSLVVHAL